MSDVSTGESKQGSHSDDTQWTSHYNAVIMRKIYTHTAEKPGYSIIAAVLMIGFLLVLTTSTLNLVLQEMRDGKGRQNYLKAFYGAEGALEYGLLQIKHKGFGYDDNDSDDISEILWDTRQDPSASYTFESAVSSYSGTLNPGDTEIIPLFWIDPTSDMKSVKNIKLEKKTGDFVWNIIGQDSGHSWVWGFTPGTSLTAKWVQDTAWAPDQKEFTKTTETIQEFLQANTGSYLMVYNPYDADTRFTLSSPSWEFTKPVADIISSAQVWKYKQNLKTSVDNTEFLGILKYSIYSN